MGTETLWEMATKALVDGLNISGELDMRKRCEDCIFGKHTLHPFNDNRHQKTKVLERVYIDLWGPAQVQSARGASYFMLIMDGYLFYWTIALLKKKSANTMLMVFKTYHIEAEWQTKRKLK